MRSVRLPSKSSGVRGESSYCMFIYGYHSFQGLDRESEGSLTC